MFVNDGNDTGILISAAQHVLKQLYKTGFNYKKAGILLMDIIPSHQHANDLFMQTTSQRSVALMQVLDEVNKIFGSHTLFLQRKAVHKWLGQCVLDIVHHAIPHIGKNLLM